MVRAGFRVRARSKFRPEPHGGCLPRFNGLAELPVRERITPGKAVEKVVGGRSGR